MTADIESASPLPVSDTVLECKSKKAPSCSRLKQRTNIATSALYIIFGIFATFSGWAIWKVYLELDSSRYPMCSYGDPFFRLFGKKSRHFINVAQSLQQFMTVAVLILSKSTNIAQISKGKICYSGVMVLVMGIGMISGIIRSLKKIGWLSNAAVFMNIANFCIIMAAAATYEPFYQAVTKSTLIKTVEPIVTFAGQPPDQFQQQVPGFASQFNAVNNMVCKCCSIARIFEPY